jgi:hypothetical protein
MALRIRVGNPRGRANAFCYVLLGKCKLVRIAAFGEEPDVARLFYGLFLQSLRSWVPASYLQISSSASWWGRRGRDVKLAPKAPIRTTSSSLLYDIRDAHELDAFVDTFWHRSPLRIYGTTQKNLIATEVDSMFEKELVETCRFLVAEDLRFVVERDTWGFFPNVLFAATDIAEVATRLQDAARVLSSPLQCDESAFSGFPLRLPERDGV